MGASRPEVGVTNRGKGVAGSRIVPLHPAEPLRLDAERLAALFLELGEARAHAALTRAIDEVEQLLDQTGRGDPAARNAEIARLGEIAEALGLVAVARAACDAVEADEAGDSHAAAAIRARLHRLTREAMRSVWRLRDLSN